MSVVASPELAAAIGMDFKNLKKAVEIGFYTSRMAFVLEKHLGLEFGSLPRTPRYEGVPRLSREDSEKFVETLLVNFPDDNMISFSRMMRVHYEKGRSIIALRVRPSVMEVRNVMASTGRRDLFAEFDREYVPTICLNEFGQRLQISRLRAELSADELCDMVGIRISTLSRVENGRRKLSREVAALAADKLNDPQLLSLWDRQL